MNNTQPIPPEGRMQCGTCGYMEIVSKYNHTCWLGRLMITAIISIIAVAIVLVGSI